MNDVSDLHPRYQPIADRFFHIVRDDLGIDCRKTEGLRSLQKQLADASSGASDVTAGWHNCGWCVAEMPHTVHYALAFDALCFDTAGNVINDGTKEPYQKCGHVAQSLGIRWPIHLKNGNADWDHFEYHPGFTFDQYIAFLRMGKDWA